MKCDWTEKVDQERRWRPLRITQSQIHYEAGDHEVWWIGTGRRRKCPSSMGALMN
jgi:hypothetical protein